MTDLITYSFSEAYGPFPCEHTVGNLEKCGKEAWVVLIEPEDFKRVPDDEVKRPRFILEKGIGLMSCDDHLNH